MLFIISGGNGSGKSTQYKIFKNEFDNVFDIDDAPISPRGGTLWRQRSTEYYIDIALIAQETSSDTYLFGHSLLGEVLSLPNADNIRGISFLLLDCFDPIRIERLKRRGDSATLINHDILNWAAWQRMHLYYPTWHIEVIKNKSLPYLQWERWENWEGTDERWNCDYYDNSYSSERTTAKFIHRWMKRKKKQYRKMGYETVKDMFH